MDIINLPGWNVVGAQETDQEYTIHAEYDLDETRCPFCSKTLLARHGKLVRHYSDTPNLIIAI